MALMSMYEDSGGNETYPRVRSAASGVGTTSAAPRATFPTDPNNPTGPVSPNPPAPTTPAAAPAPNYQTLGQYSNRLGGYDMSKFQNPYDQWSEKYKIGAVQSWFDPLKGVTPEYLSALNSLGLANFYGQGDKMGVNNIKNDPRFGTGGIADVVHGLNGQNADTMWTPWYVDDQSQQPTYQLDPSTVPPYQTYGQQPQAQAPVFQFTNSGIDPAVLQQILAMVQPQPQQQAASPYYSSTPLQTQATPMPMFTGAGNQNGSVQTQGVAPAAAPQMDPFMAWLTSRVFGGPNAGV